MCQGQKAQGILNAFKQSDPSDLPAVIFEVTWNSDPLSGSNIAAANTFARDILKTGLGHWMLCHSQQWAHADTDKWIRRQAGDTTNAVSWVGSQTLWGTLPQNLTFFVSFRLLLQESNSLYTAGAGGRCSCYLSQRLPERVNPGNTKLSWNLHCH